jgi:hypothetical protein
MALLERVHDHHEADSEDAKEGDRIHRTFFDQ